MKVSGLIGPVLLLFLLGPLPAAAVANLVQCQLRWNDLEQKIQEMETWYSLLDPTRINLCLGIPDPALVPISISNLSMEECPQRIFDGRTEYRNLRDNFLTGVTSFCAILPVSCSLPPLVVNGDPIISNAQCEARIDEERASRASLLALDDEARRVYEALGGLIDQVSGSCYSDLLDSANGLFGNTCLLPSPQATQLEACLTALDCAVEQTGYLRNALSSRYDNIILRYENICGLI